MKDPLQFPYQEEVDVDKAVLNLPHRVLNILDLDVVGYRLLFFNFSSALYTVHPSLLQEKLNIMAVDAHLLDCLTDWPQFVQVGCCRSSTLTSSTGVLGSGVERVTFKEVKPPHQKSRICGCTGPGLCVEGGGPEDTIRLLN